MPYTMHIRHVNSICMYFCFSVFSINKMVDMSALCREMCYCLTQKARKFAYRPTSRGLGEGKGRRAKGMGRREREKRGGEEEGEVKEVGL